MPFSIWLRRQAYTKVRNRILFNILRRAALALHKARYCKDGNHITHCEVTGTRNNFCEACGELINPEAFMEYDVTLRDGSILQVTAINEQHAKSKAVYGDALSFDATTGKPIGEEKVHADNIVSIKRRSWKV